MTVEFTPLASLAGGVLIGLSAALLLAANGRIAGISGIAGGLVTGAPRGDVGWRVMFLIGMIGMGTVLAAFRPELFRFAIARSTPVLVLAGLLVGFGSRLGRGCTSGHGVCGIGRLSRRSLLATLTFMATGVVTVLVVGRIFGGAL